MQTNIEMKYTLRKDDITGDIETVYDRSPETVLKEFLLDVVNHISGCKEFREIRTCPDFRTFSKLVGCDCGKSWKIDDTTFKRDASASHQLDQLFEYIERGHLSINNASVMNHIKEEREKLLRTKIADKMEKVKLMMETIDRAREIGYRKKMSCPVSSLELE